MYDSYITQYKPLLTQLTYFPCKSYSQVLAVLVLNRCAWRHKGLPRAVDPTEQCVQLMDTCQRTCKPQRSAHLPTRTRNTNDRT